jgi:hypothetical protein
MDDIENIKNNINSKIASVLVEKVKLEKEFIPIAEATLNKENNEKINMSEVIWEKAFHDIFLEILDFDSGYNKAKVSYTNALLGSGSHVNPHDGLYPFIDMLTTRLERIHIVKRICNYLGLHSEMEKIIEHELNLIYNHPRGGQSRTVELGSPIAGEGKK